MSQIDKMERAAHIKRQFNRKTDRDQIKAILGTAAGVILNTSMPGHVWVRVYSDQGTLDNRSVLAPTKYFVMKPGMPILLRYNRRGLLQVDEPDADGLLAAGVEPVGEAMRQAGSSTPQSFIETLRMIPTSPPSLSVIIKGWNVIKDNVYYEVILDPKDLTSLVPAAGSMCEVAVFVKSDNTTTEAFGSTARATTDIELNTEDIHEALALKTAGSTPIWAIKLIGGQTTITQADIDAGRDLRQMVNTFSDLVYTQTADKTVANTIDETSLIGTGVGSVTLPANFFIPGKTLGIEILGHHADTGNPTYRIKIKLGSTVILDTEAQSLGGSTGTRGFKATALITCRTRGGSGTVMGQGNVIYSTAHTVGVVDDFLPLTSAVTVDTTGTLALDITMTWGTADAANTITSTNLIVRAMN